MISTRWIVLIVVCLLFVGGLVAATLAAAVVALATAGGVAACAGTLFFVVPLVVVGLLVGGAILLTSSFVSVVFAITLYVCWCWCMFVYYIYHWKNGRNPIMTTRHLSAWWRARPAWVAGVARDAVMAVAGCVRRCGVRQYARFAWARDAVTEVVGDFLDWCLAWYPQVIQDRVRQWCEQLRGDHWMRLQWAVDGIEDHGAPQNVTVAAIENELEAIRTATELNAQMRREFGEDYNPENDVEVPEMNWAGGRGVAWAQALARAKFPALPYTDANFLWVRTWVEAKLRERSWRVSHLAEYLDTIVMSVFLRSRRQMQLDMARRSVLAAASGRLVAELR